MNSKVQLIFCGHSEGRLSFEEFVQHQPPIGILTIASYINKTLPSINIEVLDGNNCSAEELLKKIDGDIIGFSVWYSNYVNALTLAKNIKESDSNKVIIFGGPHVSALGKNILINNTFIDYIVVGEGEIPLYQFLNGVKPDLIKGLYDEITIKNIDNLQFSNNVDLNELSNLNLNLLYPKYSWSPAPFCPSMSAFPLSGIRGCSRYKIRCEYCSIHFHGYRHVKAAKFWDQIRYLKDKYGVDYFFETGDIFSKDLLHGLICDNMVKEVRFRIYGYPGLFNKNDMCALKQIGVKTVYMGVENILHWEKKFKRLYKNKFTIDNLIDEIVSYQDYGIEIIPGFLLGLPGENKLSLEKNIDLIHQIKRIENVKELSVNIVLPLPGTDYFMWTTSNETIKNEYLKVTNTQLNETDIINNELLSKLFIEEYTDVKYSQLEEVIHNLMDNIGSSMTNWNYKSKTKSEEYI